MLKDPLIVSLSIELVDGADYNDYGSKEIYFYLLVFPFFYCIWEGFYFVLIKSYFASTRKNLLAFGNSNLSSSVSHDYTPLMA